MESTNVNLWVKNGTDWLRQILVSVGDVHRSKLAGAVCVTECRRCLSVPLQLSPTGRQTQFEPNRTEPNGTEQLSALSAHTEISEDAVK